MRDSDVLGQLSGQVLAELLIANKRLIQKLEPKDILLGIRITAELGNGGCVFLQPGHSGYAWSDRKVPTALLVRVSGGIRIRIRRGRSYRNGLVTPSGWLELRGFPRGDVVSKIATWATADDGGVVSIKNAMELPLEIPSCEISKWIISSSGTTQV